MPIQIFFFENGKLCYDYIHNSADPIEIIVVISDINMPIMEGLTLLDLIKKNQPEIYVYMITAYDMKKYRDKAFSFGSDGYFTKPLDLKLLGDTLSKIYFEYIENNTPKAG